jgi:hypothetical protein
MAVLKAKQRNKLQKGTFALPSKRKYPIHDLAHAKAALSYAARSDTEGEESTVRAAVYAKYPQLKKGSSSSSSSKKKPAKKKSGAKKKSRLQPFKKS